MRKTSINQLVIFDFDGVLVNTEYTTFTFYRELLRTYDIYLTEDDFQYKIGRKSIDFFKDVLKEKFDKSLVEKFITIKRHAFIKNVKKYLQPLPGAFKLLERLYEEKIYMTIGSQNEKELLEKSVDIFNIRKYFKKIVSLQDLTYKKPNPEIFFLITRSLNISVSNAVVIEDTPIGIEAAKKAGCKCVGITTSFSEKDLRAADFVIHAMTELNPLFLRHL